MLWTCPAESLKRESIARNVVRATRFGAESRSLLTQVLVNMGRRAFRRWVEQSRLT
jgi:hypothetical protein